MRNSRIGSTPELEELPHGVTGKKIFCLFNKYLSIIYTELGLRLATEQWTRQDSLWPHEAYTMKGKPEKWTTVSITREEVQWENWVKEPASQKPGVSKRRWPKVLNAPNHGQ